MPPTSSTLSDKATASLRTLAAGFTVWSYLSMAPIGLAGFFFLGWLWRKNPLERARRIQAMTVRAYRFQHDWLRFTHITNFNHRWPIEGIPEGPCVVIANHPTLMDITSISAVLGGGCTIVKPQMFRRPLLHPLIVGAGHIEGPSSDVITIGKVVEDSIGRLNDGFRIIIFPEGTRSKKTGMLPFGRTAFEIACRAGVPLVSLTIQCDPVYLSKDVLVYRPPHPTPQLRLGLLSVDDPATVNNNSRELRRIVQDRYKAWWNRTQLGHECPPSNSKEL